MTKDRVKDYTLYKLRFWIGYALLSLLIIGVFAFAALYVPGGITLAEQKSALISASINFSQPTSLLIVDLPYHLLQKLSLFLFDLSSFSIKLPSLIAALITTAALVLLLSRRFSQTLSIITAGILVVSAFFISLAATGTPDVMMALWPAVLLCLASYAVHNKSVRTSLIYASGVVAALSLFTPFMLYIFVAVAISAVLHPRVRYLLRHVSQTSLVAGGMLIAAALGIVIWASLQDTTFAAQLFYKSDSFSTDILANLKLIMMQIIDFASLSTEKTGLLAPVFGLSLLAFGAMGAYHLWRQRYSALSYVTFGWLLILLPIILFNPSELQLLVVPAALLIASGIGALLRYWYRLFPKNPYARIFALVPTTILFACVIIPGAMRYFYSFHYYAPLANTASYDIALIAKEIKAQPHAALLVAPSEQPLYRLYLDTHDNTQTKLLTTSASIAQNGFITQDVIATRESELVKSSIRPHRIVASSKLQAPSDRIYIYHKTAK